MNKQITVEINDHLCDETEHGSFVLQDVRDMAKYSDVIYDSIIELGLLTVSDPGKGYGSLCIRNYLSEVPDDVIVIVKVEPIYATEEEYQMAVKSGAFESTLTRLVSFYSKHNFLNINDHIGYEFGVAMIYGNAIGKTIDLCFDRYKVEKEKEN